MSLFKAETPERVSIPKDEYIELEKMKYKLCLAQEYIVMHKVVNRETIGAMLGIPQDMLKGGF